LATSRPDLSVWVVTGDGDSLSIGGNHLIHALRRNVNIKILMFNNEIYWPDKGPVLPDQPARHPNVKSTPMGSLDWPFNPLSLAIGAKPRSWRGRDRHRSWTSNGDVACRSRASWKRLRRDLPELQHLHDGAFDFVREDKTNRIYLEHGKPIRFGEEGRKGVRQRTDGSVRARRRDRRGRVARP